MTRKRKTIKLCAANKTRSRKPRNLLATRLIEISMVLDKYVYNNKPIATKDAALYIQEICAYKIHCKQDERSLQVIEKLTRCMQSIISDNETNFSIINSTSMGNNAEVSLSPVYSLPDEDKTQFNEDPLISDNNIDPLAEQIETIDLCDDDAGQPHTEINVDVEMHGAISNLSLRENPLQKAMRSPSILDNLEQSNLTGEIDSSQSILKNFDHSNTHVQTDHTWPQNFKVLKGTNKLPFKEPIINNKPNITDIKLNKKPKVTNESKIVQLEHDYSIKNLTDVTLTKTDPVKKNTRKINTKIHPRKDKNETNKEKKKINRKNTKSSGTNDHNKSIEYQKIGNNIEIQKNTVKEAETQKRVTTHVNMSTTLPSYKMNTNINSGPIESNPVPEPILLPVNNKPIANVYNSYVENDLSWMENIRYVREISAEEFDTKLTFEDSFWENCALPSNWDEQDFEYN